MASRSAEIGALLGRVKAAGWKVTTTSLGWKITAPDGYTHVLHKTPGRNWKYQTTRDLNAHGFEADELHAAQRRDAEREERLAEGAKVHKRRSKVEANRAVALRRAVGIEPCDLGWLSSPHATMAVRFLWITPADAAQLLTLPRHNRDVRPTRMARYRRAMDEGRWLTSGQTMQWDTAANNQDGQHRLIALSGSTVDGIAILCVVGVPADAYKVTDTGAPRSIRDAIRTERPDAKYAGTDGPALRVIYRVQNDIPATMWPNFAIDNDEVMELWRKHGDELIAAASMVRGLRSVGISHAGATAFVFLAKQSNAAPVVDRFVEGLKRGSMLDFRDPRAAFLRLVDVRQRARLHENVRFISLVRCWNDWIAGITKANYQVRDGMTLPPIGIASDDFVKSIMDGRELAGGY